MNIEERAHQFGIKKAGGWYESGTKGMIYQGSKDTYIEIATEQEKITKQEMIDKARNWLDNEFTSGTNIEGVRNYEELVNSLINFLNI